MGVSKNYHERAMHTNYDVVKKNLEHVLKLKAKNNYDLIIHCGMSVIKGYKYADILTL